MDGNWRRNGVLQSDLGDVKECWSYRCIFDGRSGAKGGCAYWMTVSFSENAADVASILSLFSRVTRYIPSLHISSAGDVFCAVLKQADYLIAGQYGQPPSLSNNF